MKIKTMLLIVASSLLFSCGSKPKQVETIATKDSCNDSCKQILSCKLTTPEMDKRKATVLKSLRKQIMEKKELPNGYAYKFIGNDKMIDELTDFAKTERHCCDFFTFNIAITGDSTFLWLQITGPKEAKEFIITELEL